MERSGVTIETQAEIQNPSSTTETAVSQARDEAVSDSRRQLFVELFEEQRVRIYAFIRTFVFNRVDTDDLVQEVSLVLWKKFDEFEEGTNFNAWALSVAHWQVRAHFKRQKRLRRRFSLRTSEELANSVEARIDQPNLRLEALAECVSLLNDRDSELLQRRYEAGEAPKDLASSLGRSVFALYKSLRRVHSQLLECVRRRMKSDEEKS